MPKVRVLWSEFKVFTVCAELTLQHIVSATLLVAIPPRLTSSCSSFKHFTHHSGRTEVKQDMGLFHSDHIPVN